MNTVSLSHRQRSIRYALLGALLLGGCGHLGSSQDQPQRAVDSERGAIILTRAALEGGEGSVLSAMTAKVPNFRVRRNPQEYCPQITLRGATTFRSYSNPDVYVDGTRAVNTCVLDTLMATDVARVEIYAQGYTTRPGYGTNAHGLILIFMVVAD